MPDHPHHQIISTIQLPPILAVQSKNATVVVAEAPWGIQVAGESKREPFDQQNYARGYRLALGRALINLGYEIQRQERRAIRQEILEQHEAHRQLVEEFVAGAVERSETAKTRDALAKKYANTPQARAKRAARAKRRAQI